jgi:hypothetical protein
MASRPWLSQKSFLKLSAQNVTGQPKEKPIPWILLFVLLGIICAILTPVMKRFLLQSRK